jgi:hypothetical protein
MVEGGGFEPPKAEPSDLQSDPFGHSGTPPKNKPPILLENRDAVNRAHAETAPGLAQRRGHCAAAMRRHTRNLVPEKGVEPSTFALQVRCSTN